MTICTNYASPQDTHSQVVLFDLDDTLYPHESGVMQHIGQRIEIYLRERMHMSAAQAQTLRQRYWEQYGTTLHGLMSEQHIDPEDYLTFVHNVPLEQLLQPNPQLDQVLAGIAQRKVIFTNATHEHAERVLARLGVARHFERIIALRDFDYRSKKSPDTHQRALRLLQASGAACMLVEDILHNLTPARSLGMTTVWVSSQACCPPEVDFCIPSVLNVGPIVQIWRQA